MSGALRRRAGEDREKTEMKSGRTIPGGAKAVEASRPLEKIDRRPRRWADAAYSNVEKFSPFSGA